MPVQERIATGIGVDLMAPNPYSAPTPVENFRWDRADGYLKWDKALDSELSGGYYQLQYSDNSGSSWTNLVQVTQASISGTTGSYQDTTGSPGRWYQIKKVTSAATGSVSSIYVGPRQYETTTDRCYIMLYVQTLDLEIDESFSLKVAMNLASTVYYVTYKNKGIVPVVSISKNVETNSGLIIVPVIPSALITNANTAVKYNFILTGKGKVKQTWSNKTVPTAASAYLLDLT
jgi:hypothetical protein